MSMSEQEKNHEAGLLFVKHNDAIQEVACLDSQLERIAQSYRLAAEAIDERDIVRFPADLVGRDAIQSLIQRLNGAESERLSAEHFLKRMGRLNG